jgi:hypothetical protein
MPVFHSHSQTSISQVKHVSALCSESEHTRSCKKMSSWCSLYLLRPPALPSCPAYALHRPECVATATFNLPFTPPNCQPITIQARFSTLFVIWSLPKVGRSCHLGDHPTSSGHLPSSYALQHTLQSPEPAMILLLHNSTCQAFLKPHVVFEICPPRHLAKGCKHELDEAEVCS